MYLSLLCMQYWVILKVVQKSVNWNYFKYKMLFFGNNNSIFLVSRPSNKCRTFRFFVPKQTRKIKLAITVMGLLDLLGLNKSWISKGAASWLDLTRFYLFSFAISLFNKSWKITRKKEKLQMFKIKKYFQW